MGERTSGFDHLRVAHSLLNLGDLYREQGKYDLVEALYQRALGIREQILGSNHPNVAHLHNSQGDLLSHVVHRTR